MGIPSYFSYIIKNHSNILKKQNQIGEIDNLYLDSNSIIYDSLKDITYTNTTEFEKKLIESVISTINKYIKLINPKKNVLIAFDGVAPVAKLEQQRTRRYKSKLTEEIIEKIKNEPKKSGWDRTAITPGTKFMKKMGNHIKKHFSKNKDVILSSSDIEGEGEHKIFDFIRNNPEKHRSETTIIYGLDADLIMLSLCNSDYCDKIYVYRETPEFIKSIDYNFEPNELYCLDIKSLSTAIIYEMTNKVPNKTSNNSFSLSKKNILYDYIFICFLLGNDFLPHFPSLNIRTYGISTLLSAYYNTLGINRNYIINNGTIEWGKFKKLIKWIKENESENLLIEYEIRDKFEKRKYETKTIEDKLNIMPIKKRDIEKEINPSDYGWEKRYYKNLFDSHNTKQFVKNVSINYLEGLEWVFKYYTKGCSDWKWRYNYHYPPLFKDLFQYIPDWETTMIPENNNKPLQPETQLAYVIPFQSLHLLTKEKRNKLLKKYPHFHSNNFELKWSFCKYFWEAHVCFPNIDINEFEENIS